MTGEKELAAAFQLLELDKATVNEKVLSDAFRAKAMSAHPDRGGDAQEFHAVKNAERVVAAWLQARPYRRVADNACVKCEGSGVMKSHKGFRALRMQCIACRGTGEQDYEHDLGDGR